VKGKKYPRKKETMGSNKAWERFGLAPRDEKEIRINR